MANVRFLDQVSVSAFGNTGDGGGSSISSSYAETASFAQSGDGNFSGSFSGSFQGDGSNLTGVGAFPFSGSAVITGSLIISGSQPSGFTPVEKLDLGRYYFKTKNSFDIGLLGSFGGELIISSSDFDYKTPMVVLDRTQGPFGDDIGTDLWARNNLFAGGSTYVNGVINTLFSVTGSGQTGQGGVINLGNPYNISPTNNVINLHGHLTASAGVNISASATSTASFGTYLGDGSNLTGIVTDPFPYTGSALISGSLNLTGSLSVNSGIINLSSTPTSPGVNSQVNIGADSDTSIKVLKVYSNAGYVEIGPQNASFSHFYTDRAKYYFNKPLQVAGEVMSHTDQDLVLGSRGGTSDTITIGTNDIIFELNNNNIFYMTTGSSGLDSILSGSATSTASFGTYLGDGSQLTGISTTPFPFSGSAVITGSLVVSGSSKPLEVIGSGSTVFSIQGSLGELFAIDDQLSGSLLVVNNISGLPQFEVFSDGRTLIGADPRSLYTTAIINATSLATSQSIYSLSTSSYDGVFFDYTVTSASNARAGNIMSIWNGGNLVYTENTTTDIGSTTGVTFNVEISQSQAQLISVTDTEGWKIKTTIRSI